MDDWAATERNKKTMNPFKRNRQVIAKWLVYALVLSLLLAACATPATAPTTAITAQPTSALSEATSSGDTRTTTDPTGRTVEIPANPQRVVVLDPGAVVFSLVELGLVPIGATTDVTTVGGGFPQLLGEARNQITAVGDSTAPNLEQVAELKPDLIFHHKEFSDPGVDNLSALAPTIQFTNASFGPDPTVFLRFVAEVVNRQEQAEAIIQQWEARLAEAAGQAGLQGKRCVVPILYAFEPAFNLYGPDNIATYIGRRLGCTIVPQEFGGQPLQDYSETISLEKIGEAVEGADLVLLLRFEPGLTGGKNESSENYSIITSSPVWQSLPAVKEGRVIELDAMTGRGDYGFAGWNATLDQLLQARGVTVTDAPAADGASTRTIIHAMGETEVPANPQRIVVAGYNESEDLVALGVKPVGVMYDAVSRSFLQAALQDVPVIGAEDRPNLEKIVALKPDLIIAVNWAAEGIYPELSAIAPTVVVDRGAGFAAWRESLSLVADVVGRSEGATELLADYDQRVSELRATLQARQLDELQVSVFGSWNAQFAIFNYVEGFPINILNEVGLQVTETQRDLYAANPEAFDAMSLEFLPQLDGDRIFFLDSTIEGQGGDKAFVSGVKNNPLFTKLSAVQAGKVCEVPYGRWNEGSVLAANLILDDIERCLLQQNLQKAGLKPAADKEKSPQRLYVQCLRALFPVRSRF
jgi:iron complex transport system substrate-binding protein